LAWCFFFRFKLFLGYKIINACRLAVGETADWAVCATNADQTPFWRFDSLVGDWFKDAMRWPAMSSAVLAKCVTLFAAILDPVAKILAARESDGFDDFAPGVALADSGNPGLISSTPLVSLSVPRYARDLKFCG
jgi:hypothetical protein